MSGLVQVAGGFSQSISSGSVKRANGSRKRLQFRLKLAIDESYGSLQVRKALALSRLVDITAMRDALVAVGRVEQCEYLMRQAGMVADDEEKFAFAIAAANVVMSRPSERQSEASAKFSTWGQLARAWCSQELDRMYPNAGYGKKSAEGTDEPRVEFICKYIADAPLATFSDDDYWRAMRPARARCKTDATFKAYSQVVRRVLKIAVELRIIPAWPLSAVCKLPKITKGTSPEFPFLYPEEYVRLVRCRAIRFEYRVLWGFIIREGLRISEAHRIEWQHLSQLDNGKWLLDVPDTKTGRALNFVFNAGTGEVLAELRRRMPELAGPFKWLKATNIKKAAEGLRKHIELSGTTRERLLFTEGRLRRLREHDLRSTYVTWCKLAGVDNETISQHTGHESSTMIARYNRSRATVEHLGLAPYLPLDAAFGSLAEAAEVEQTSEAAAQPATVAATEIDSGNRPGQGPDTSTPGAALPGARLGAAEHTAERLSVAGRSPQHDGAQAPREGIPSPRGETPEAAYTTGGALNSWHACDATRDARPEGEAPPAPPVGETSMIDALCARGDSNSQARRRRNLNPNPSNGNAQTADKPGGDPAPEATGNHLPSHPGVTLLEQLEAARRQAGDEHNWAAARALEPVIDAELRRIAEAARAAPPEPVRLEVVRAKRGEGGSR
jgi:integrase